MCLSVCVQKKEGVIIIYIEREIEIGGGKEIKYIIEYEFYLI